MEEKVLCPKCGEGINEDFAICPYCGQELYDEETEEYLEEEEIEEEVGYVRLTENTMLVKKLKTISIVIKTIFYLLAIIFVCLGFILGVETEGSALVYFVLAVIYFFMGLVGTVFIEWMALTLETLDKIKNKKN